MSIFRIVIVVWAWHNKTRTPRALCHSPASILSYNLWLLDSYLERSPLADISLAIRKSWQWNLTCKMLEIVKDGIHLNTINISRYVLSKLFHGRGSSIVSSNSYILNSPRSSSSICNDICIAIRSCSVVPILCGMSEFGLTNESKTISRLSPTVIACPLLPPWLLDASLLKLSSSLFLQGWSNLGI